MSSIDPNLLDEETVNTFLEMGQDVISSLVDLYIENSTEEIQKLLQYPLESHLEEAKKTAHSLKGASFNTGASAMGQLCLEIEKNIKENNTDAARVLITQLSPLLEKTRQAFQQSYE
jgi:HPt (histidine-containing phosphotransfer) domain-containing protein